MDMWDFRGWTQIPQNWNKNDRQMYIHVFALFPLQILKHWVNLKLEL
jgi:hypothetical protein